ncbi:MAG: hypothetical protein A3E85_01565 [Gammaproteobacteria bacterium RIFCSPHIGHO2_12_FULL_45_12]|nr:MAG: hypothetical protein A3E85_01565 [Gammaproteobacteria bacterium RIFCSPHIGHO2_12_FULL_45_12]
MPNEPKKEPVTLETNGSHAANRHHARRYALQAMYQWQLAGTPISTIEAEFVNYQIDRSLDLDYFKTLIHGVPENQADIDNALKPFLSRSIQEIDPVELAVLRIATFELIKRADVPYRVIINEALELTKKFGSIEGFKFVNGLLDRVAKQHRPIEIST